MQSSSPVSFYSIEFHFLALNNIVLRMCHNLSINLLKDILVVSELQQLWIKLLQTSTCRFSCGYKFSAHLGKYWRVWLMDLKAGVSIVSLRNAKLSKWLYHFAFPPAMNQSSCCSTFSLESGVIKCFRILDTEIIWSSMSVLFELTIPWWHIMLGIFSYAYLSCVYLLWWGVLADIFPTF